MDSLKTLFDSLHRRLRLLFARAIVRYVHPPRAGRMQTVQITGLAGETIDPVQHAQNYGLAARVLPGAEAFLGAVMGNRDHLVAVAVDDPRHRPAALQPGEVVVWSVHGQRIALHEDGHTSIASPGPLTVEAPKVIAEAREVTVKASEVAVSTGKVTIEAQSAALDCGDIACGGEGAAPVARVGDLVEIGAGSSAGRWPIVTGSAKMRVG